MQKRSVCVIVTVSLLPVLLFGLAPSVHAETSNVLDWIEEEQHESEAQQDVEAKGEGATLNLKAEKSFSEVVGQLFLYTLLILALIYGLIKFLALRQKKLKPNQAVKLMGGTPLGNNKSLQFVKVGEKIYLLGVADQVTLIKEFASDAEIKQIEQDLDNQPEILSNAIRRVSKGPRHDFRRLLNQMLDKQRAEHTGDESEGRTR